MTSWLVTFVDRFVADSWEHRVSEGPPPGECPPVIGTEFEVGQTKVLRAMGAKIQDLSHKGLC